MSTQRTPRLSLRDVLYGFSNAAALSWFFCSGRSRHSLMGSLILKPTYEATAKLLFKSGREDVGSIRERVLSPRFALIARSKSTAKSKSSEADR